MTTSADTSITADNLIRATGPFAIAAGLIFAGIQPIHPPDFVASVTTMPWAVIISLKFAMCLFFMIGIAGLYFRQMSKAGWLGLAGFVVFSLSWWLQTGYVFVDLFILPPLASVSPDFVDSFLGIVNQHPGTLDIGAMGPAYGVLGLLYLLGGIVFGQYTATEAGVAACVYGLLVGLFFYRELGWRDVRPIMVEAVEMTAIPMYLFATGGVFGWLLTIYDFGPWMVDWMKGFDFGPTTAM